MAENNCKICGMEEDPEDLKNGLCHVCRDYPEGSYDWHLNICFKGGDPTGDEEDAFQSGWRRRESELLPVLEWTLTQLENLTTAEYSAGGDKAIREKLQETIAKARGQA